MPNSRLFISLVDEIERSNNYEYYSLFFGIRGKRNEPLNQQTNTESFNKKVENEKATKTHTILNNIRIALIS